MQESIEIENHNYKKISVLTELLFLLKLNAATTKIARPVVIIDGKDAKKLMNIVKK